MKADPKPFLTAQWSYLVMLNYKVPAQILADRLPPGVDLDDWQGETLVSMVGFMFRDTRLKGVAVPFHRDFEEVNLRFYVRRTVDGTVRRGVVFIKEIVPKPALSFVARLVYNENYVTMPMSHHLVLHEDRPLEPVAYTWRSPDLNLLQVTAQGEAQVPPADSQARFITEHYWGYARQKDGGAIEYRVDHAPWRVWAGTDPVFQCDVAGIYGKTFAPWLARPPVSAFLALGGKVQVFSGTRIH